MTRKTHLILLLADAACADLADIDALLDSGHETVVRTSSISDALAALDQHDPAAVFIDVRRNADAGMALARAVRACQTAVATPLVFVMAGDGSGFDCDAALGLGAVDFLGMPSVGPVVRAKAALFAEMHRARRALAAGDREDIDARYRAEQELWRTTLASIGDAVVATDTARRVTFLNAEAERLTGWAHEQAQGLPLDQVLTLLNESTRERVDCPVAKVLRTGRLVGLANHTVVVGRNGSLHPVDDSAAPIRSTAGVLHGVVLVFRDISARQAAAEELREAHSQLERRVVDRTAELQCERQLLQAVLDAVEDGVVACNADGALTVFNRASREFHGMGATTAAAAQWTEQYQLYRADGVTPLPTTEIPLVRALKGELVRDAEMVIQGPGQPVRRVRAVGYPLQDAAGAPLGAVVSMHDVTAEREHAASLEAALREQARRQAAEATARTLRESQERFERLIESSSVGIYGMDREGVCTFMNTAGAEMLGYAAQELVGRRLHTLIHHHRADGSDYPESACRLNQAARGGLEARVDDEVFWHRDGHAVPVIYSTHPMRVDGRLTGSVINFSDVSERRAAEERLRASEERVRLATDAAELGVWVWDMQIDRVTWENDRLYAMFGVPRTDEPINGARFAGEFLHPDDLRPFQERLAVTLETGVRFNFQCRFTRRSDGAERWSEFTGLMHRDEHGAPHRLLGTVADITERKHDEVRLQQSEERYRTLFESMDEGFCVVENIVDAEGHVVDHRFIEINPAFEQHSGLVGAAGRTLREMVPHLDGRWLETFGEVAATGVSTRFEEHSAAMGRWFDIYASRVGGPGSDRVAVLFNDITDRKRAEEDLRRLAADLSEIDRRKTEFLATLAHELRNPLAPLRNGLHLMARAPDDATVIARAREMMQRQVGQMVHLVDDLLDIARITRGKVELKRVRVELNTVVASAVETSMPLIDSGGHTLDVDLPAAPLVLDVDPVRMAQVIGNLLNNAAKYTPGGGHIALVVRREGDEAVVSVSDNGVGIPPDSLAAVFEMFTQVGRNLERAQGGLGIGLTLVRRLVELHGGSVVARSAGVDQGATFTVRLPLASVLADAGTAEAAGGAAAAPRRLRVLVVDDNIDAADSMAALLEMGGHLTRVAHDGLQAIQAASDFLPEVVFLDIGIPGKNGYEVARALRTMSGLEGALLVALTGWGSAEDRTRSRDAGFDEHLTKPAEYSEIDRLLHAIGSAAAVA